MKRRPANRKPPKRRKPDYFDIITARLEQSAKRAEKAGVEAFILKPVRNADKSVDGEIRFIRPRGEDTRSFVIDVEGWIIIPKGVWVSVGGRFEPTTAVMDHIRNPATSRYEKEQGLINIGAFFQRGKSKAAVFLAARKFLQEMEETIKRKVLEVYVRLHWDPTDTKPERIGTPVSKRRKPANRKPVRKPKKGKSRGKVSRKKSPAKRKPATRKRKPKTRKRSSRTKRKRR